MSNDRRAATLQPIHDLLAERWSPRAFADRAVTHEMLGSLFEAARWAPSCFNDQPWYFVFGCKGESDDGDAWNKVHDCLVEANQVWAKHAPVLGISVARTKFTFNGNDNRHAMYDTGAAAFALTVQAQARGLAVHQMGGFDADAAKTAFGIPADHTPMAAIAIGYEGSADQLEGDLAERERAPRERRALGQTVFGGAWGEAHPATE